ncbi:MAG: class I adenylate-forming enzyme family protein [Actinocrinis sp.]
MSTRGVRRPDSVLHLLEVRARQEPERTAVRVLGGGSLEFGRWLGGAQAVAAGLAERGARPGDRIVLRFDSREWDVYALCFLGVLAAGCVAVPVSERAAPAELALMLEHCEPVGVLRGSRLEAPAGPWWVEAATAAVDGDPAGSLAAWTPGHPAQILYTSGTTGRPKAVLADHANLVHGCVLDPRLRPLRHSEHFLHSFPIGTNAGQTMLVNALNAHAGALVAPAFTPRSFARAIEAHQVGSVFLVPAMAAELIGSHAAARADLTGVRLVGSTAAPLTPVLAAGLAKAFPSATIVNTYTSTEAAPAFTAMIVDPARPAALGRPVDGAVRILDEQGAAAAAGVTGEVWLRSPVSPRSYYRAERADGAVFRGRWIRMGDLGYFDEDGFLFLVDRDGDVIKTGAFKVSTLQVENALHEHPGVCDAAVFGLGHPVLGTVPAAAVVLGAPETTAEQLRAFLAPRVASHAVPQRFLFVARLPRNPAGQVLKRLLREQAERGRAERADHSDVRVQEVA